MIVLSFCPNCKHIVAIDKYGLIKCSRCGHCFVVDLNYKQKKVVDNNETS